MKKKGAILGLLLISVLLISVISSVSFVSANLFNGVWNKITGKVVEDNETDGIETAPIEEEICGDGICQEGEKCDKDCCEAFCTLECPDGAVQGSCGCECIVLELEPPVEKEDDDDDDEKQCNEGEIKYYVCEDGTKIPECKCEGGWVCKISVEDDCPDVGPGPEICAAKIKVTFNKGSYQIGEDVKIIIEVFDSQGNHLPDYAFYGQMYDDRWHTPDLQKTDNKGYFIHTGKAEKPAGGVTKVRFKVYTKETGSCGSVEDIIEVKFQPKGCGIGECEPEPECKDKVRMCGGDCPPCPEDDEDKEIFYPCSGCELEEKCYPYGYRKSGSYCSAENDAFVNQFGDDEKCENNFECETNLCINGNCVSSKLWDKFLGWFKKLFGGDEESKDCSKFLIEKDIEDYEYVKSEYGPSKESQVPLFTDEGEQIGTIKCCVALYDKDEKVGIGLVCPYENREYVENLVKQLTTLNKNFVLKEYKGQKVYQDRVSMVWAHENYVIAVGTGPDSGAPFPEPIADAYFKKYKNDLEEIEIGDLPPRPPNSVELCGEIEDNIERAGCYIDVAISKSDFEICENIVYDSEHKNKCYVNVAEHTGDANICDNVVDNSLREKCYFWVAEQKGDVGVCEEMEDSSLQAECYVGVAEKTGDASYCDKITDSHIGDKCYRDVGIQTNDKSLCEKIIEDRARQKCLDNTS